MYCVRPNSGVVASGESIDINIILQESASKQGKTKDKMLIQTVCESDVPEDAIDAFKSVPKALIMEDKLQCKWVYNDERVSFKKLLRIIPPVIRKRNANIKIDVILMESTNMSGDLPRFSD
eukprot:m.115614 g.115614  ORF g.115614 m.115614 type:complete len:121 (+) comp17147_c0_seq8:233-595(+)